MISHISVVFRFCQEIVVDMGYVHGTLIDLGPLVNHSRWNSYADSDECVILLLFASKHFSRSLFSNFVEIRALVQPKLLELILDNC
jgi:hypothetical protein